MSVATYHVTNNAVDTFATYKASIDGNFAVLSRLGVMFAPNAQSSPNMTIQLQAGHIFDGASLTEVAAQNTATITAPVSNPRIDRVVIDKVTGAVSVVAGTTAASPVPPAIPSGKCPVAQIALTSSTTSITNSILTDERDFSGLGGQSGVTPFGTATNSGNNYSVTLSPAISALTAGQPILVKMNAANNGSATVNPNAIGATTVKDNFTNNLAGGEFRTNSVYLMISDGTNLIMMNQTVPYAYLQYGADSGAANAYVLTPAPALRARAAGVVVPLIPANANTGPSTLQVSGLTAGNIKMLDGSDPYANALLTTGAYLLMDDGTNYRLLNPSLRNFVGDTGAGGQAGLVPAPGAGDAAAGKVLGAGGAFVNNASGTTVFDGTLSNLTSQNFTWTPGQFRSVKIELINFAQSANSGVITTGLLRLIDNGTIKSSNNTYKNNMWDDSAMVSLQTIPSGGYTLNLPGNNAYNASNSIAFTGTGEVPVSNAAGCCSVIYIDCMNGFPVFNITTVNTAASINRKFFSFFLNQSTLFSGVQLLLSSGSRAFSTNSKCRITGYP